MWWSISLVCTYADGSLLDAALLAAVAALRSLAMPAVAVNEEGTIVPSPEADSAGSAAPDPQRQPRSACVLAWHSHAGHSCLLQFEHGSCTHPPQCISVHTVQCVARNTATMKL